MVGLVAGDDPLAEYRHARACARPSLRASGWTSTACSTTWGAARNAEPRRRWSALAGRPLATHADAVEAVDEVGRHLLERRCEREGFAAEDSVAVADPGNLRDAASGRHACRTSRRSPGCSTFVCRAHWYPRCGGRRTRSPTSCAALEGGYVPAGPSGAPTRGMAHVLPTGRNFYAVDPRALPSHAAWQVGQELAREVVERHRAETGAYPETVGISIWGTSAMRTHGDDVAAGAGAARRPAGLAEGKPPASWGSRSIPLAELGPAAHRCDDAHQRLLPRRLPAPDPLLDEAVERSPSLDEPTEQNFVRKHYLADLERRRTMRTRRLRVGAERALLPHLRLQARALRGRPPAADRRTQLARRCRSGRDLRQLGRLCLHGRRARASMPATPSAAGSRGVAGRPAQPGQSRTRHLRQRRLFPVPRRHDRHHPRPDRPASRGIISATRTTRPGPAVRDLKEEALRVFRTPRRQSQMARRASRATATRAGSSWRPPSITCSATTPPPTWSTTGCMSKSRKLTCSTRRSRSFSTRAIPGPCTRSRTACSRPSNGACGPSPIPVSSRRSGRRCSNPRRTSRRTARPDPKPRADAAGRRHGRV